MYKDKEAQRMAVRKAVEKHRQGITGPVTLSDGQLWYPNNYGYHPRECQCKAHPDRSWMTDYTEMITPKGL